MNIQTLTQGVLTNLDRYIALHNNVFAKKWWQYFKPIDFGSLASNAMNIHNSLNDNLDQLRKLNLNGHYSDYASALEKYIISLISTLNAFQIVLSNLKDSAKGHKYAMKDYKEHLSIYHEMVERYTEYGLEVNKLYRNEFSLN